MTADRRDQHSSTVLRSLVAITRRGLADARSDDVPLSVTDQSILMAIAEQPGIRSTDIARMFRLNRSTVSRQLATLTALGIVGEAEGESGRGRPLTLTQEGTAAYRDTLSALQRIIDAHLAPWSDDEVSRFAHDLERFDHSADLSWSGSDAENPTHKVGREGREMKNITVLGTGVLGSQIAFQTAFHGFDVVAYDVDRPALTRAAERFQGLVARYEADSVDGAADGGAAAAIARIRLTSNLADAVSAADLVIEAAPENLELKQRIYRTIGAAAPAATVFATNSSTLLPSALAESTGRPERFLALHFANEIWSHNTAEVMGTEATDPAVYAAVVEFARSIGMVPIEIKKEKAGYLLNSLLVPFLQAAGELLVDGIAEPEAIDATWRIGTGAPAGPFEIYDIVGLTTAYNISRMGGEKQQAFADLIKERYIDQGKLGVATGEGFYAYPRS